MDDQLVGLTLRDDVAWVQLTRPPVNALDSALVEALAETVLELEALQPRAAVFSGGPRTLAAGGDVKWMLERGSAGDRLALRRFLRGIQRLFDDVERLPFPTIAVVRGYTLGGGLELALACDLRVAADDAKVGFPEATLGLLPAAGGTQRLAEAVGRGIALELLYTGRMIGAEEAQQLGLLNRVVAAEEVDDAASALLDEVLRSTPDALTAIKACVQANVLDGRPAGSRTESRTIEGLAVGAPALARLEEFQNRNTRSMR
jgi:enoyl-CoA hydratase